MGEGEKRISSHAEERKENSIHRREQTGGGKKKKSDKMIKKEENKYKYLGGEKQAGVEMKEDNKKIEGCEDKRK